MTIPINLATEDELSEAVLRRLIDYTKRGHAIGTTYGRGGYGDLRKIRQRIVPKSGSTAKQGR